MKKVYVIGSSSSIAAALKRLGGDCSFTFFGRSNPHKLDTFIEYGGVQDEASVDKLFALISEDIRLNRNVHSISLIVLSGVSSNDWRESFLVNEYLPAKLSEEFARCVSELPIGNRSITLVGTSAAHLGAKMPYAATKAALSGIMHTIARDFRGKVRINIMLPSAFESNMIADWDQEKRESVASNNFIGRLGSPEDMADAILFTIRNEFITNSTINMTGGTVHI